MFSDFMISAMGVAHLMCANSPSFCPSFLLSVSPPLSAFFAFFRLISVPLRRLFSPLRTLGVSESCFVFMPLGVLQCHQGAAISFDFDVAVHIASHHFESRHVYGE